jgi:hypothetical protein
MRRCHFCGKLQLDSGSVTPLERAELSGHPGFCSCGTDRDLLEKILAEQHRLERLIEQLLEQRSRVASMNLTFSKANSTGEEVNQ